MHIIIIIIIIDRFYKIIVLLTKRMKSDFDIFYVRACVCV